MIKKTIILLILLFFVCSLSFSQIIDERKIQVMRESVLLELMFHKVQEGIVFCYSGGTKTTGFFISKDGWIITAGHKVDRDFPVAHPIYVKLQRLPDAKVFQSVEILPPTGIWDLLLFKIDYKPKFYFKKFSKPFLLQENWVFGFRLASGKVPSSAGYITLDVNYPYLLLTTASVINGNSGSPVLSRNGDVLGIVVRGQKFGDGLFISSNWVKKYLKENLK